MIARTITSCPYAGVECGGWPWTGLEGNNAGELVDAIKRAREHTGGSILSECDIAHEDYSANGPVGKEDLQCQFTFPVWLIEVVREQCEEHVQGEV